RQATKPVGCYQRGSQSHTGPWAKQMRDEGSESAELRKEGGNARALNALGEEVVDADRGQTNLHADIQEDADRTKDRVTVVPDAGRQQRIAFLARPELLCVLHMA